ncbi:MAG: T9SS type A sorting domain-containing protein [Candidatus Zixiibacteriota bacterium]|nr:MAG: T9SS type A sorting domain-containing protein [candidate division Zixibacteria bacterium]
MNTLKFLIIITTFLTGFSSALAQEYVYPNKKLCDQGLLEYRRYTLEEAMAYDEGSSFAPYTTLAWGPERRLTEQENVYRARVVTSGDSLFVTYSLILGMKTHFIRSLDSGESWEPHIALEDSNRPLFQLWPEIMNNGPNLMIGLGIQEPGEGNNLCFYRSTNYGSTWGDINEVLPITSWDYSYFASFNNVGNRVYASYRNSARDSIYVIKSTDWGDIWNGRGVNIAYLSSTPQPMTVRAWGNTVHLVWVNENQPISCRYSRSTDMGQTWSDEIDISNDSLGAQVPFIAVQDTHVVVCWMGYKYSPHSFTGDLFIKQSFDYGETWGDEQVLTDLHKVRIGAIYCEDSLLSAVWMDARFGGGNDEVYARTSYDYGITWSDEERLSFGDDHSYTPISCKTGEKIHVLWGDQRSTAPGLYYRVNDPSTAITEHENQKPTNIYLYAYPNPFNSRTLITYKEIEGGNIGIYNITGRLIKTLTVSGKEGGIVWDATDDRGIEVSSGVYFIKARTTNGKTSRKAVYLR